MPALSKSFALQVPTLYDELEFNHDDELIDELRDLGYDLGDHSLSESDFRDLDFDEYDSDGADIILDVTCAKSSMALTIFSSLGT